MLHGVIVQQNDPKSSAAPSTPKVVDTVAMLALL
jgi:hypothetical protein